MYLLESLEPAVTAEAHLDLLVNTGTGFTGLVLKMTKVSMNADKYKTKYFRLRLSERPNRKPERPEY